MIDPRVQDLLDEVGLSIPLTQQATLNGQDPILANRFPVSEAAAAALAAGGVAASDLWSLKTGRRQDVAVDVRKAGLSLRATLLMRLNGGPPPSSWADGNPLVDFYPCRDGRWIHLHGNFPHLAEGTMAVLGCTRDRDEIAAAVARRDAQELEDALAASRQCGAMARTAVEWAAHPQGQAIANTPRVEITRIGDSDPEPLPAGHRPLSGIRVLDLTRMLAGPYATMLLADMGAEVIKVEDPAGDPIRRMGPPFEADGRSAYFMAVNRNKRSVVLDLRDERDRDRFLELVRTADAVVDNFRAGVMERLRLTPDHLRAVRPDIVTCSVTAFGSDGPYRDLPAFDLVLQAMGGGMSITGEPGGAPTRSGIPIGDLAGGIFAALAVCAALLRRERTGLGEHVDLSLLDVQVSLLTYVAQYHLTDGRVPGPVGTGHPSVVPYQAFATADGHVVIAVFGENFWAPLCRALALDDLAGRFPDNRSRFAHRDEVVACIQSRLSERTTDEWVRELWAAGVPSGPVSTIDRVLRDPQVRHRGMVVGDGERELIGNPVKTGAPDRFRPAPALGQDDAELLGR